MMTIKDLNNLTFIKKDIKELKEEIEALNNLGSSEISDMPKGTITSNPTEEFVVRKLKLEKKLNEILALYLEELEEMNDFINSIEEPEIRLIVRLKYVKGMTWYDVAEYISGTDKYLDRSAPKKRLDRYFEKKFKKI